MDHNNFYNRLVSYSQNVLFFVRDLPNEKLFWSISDQLLRSATSIGANIIEAKASSSRKDFVKFYEIALKSANETIYWFEIIKKIIPECLSEKLNVLQKETCELAKIIGASVLTMKSKNNV